MSQESSDAPEQSAASVRTLEMVVAIFFLLIGSVVMWDSARTGANWGDDGPQSGYFPFYMGLLMNVASAANLWLAFKSCKAESFVSKPQFKLVLAVFLPCLVYVVLMQWLGLYVSSLVFIAVFMRWQGKFSWLKSSATALSVVMLLFVMFEIWFKVPLIKGPLEAALGF